MSATAIVTNLRVVPEDTTAPRAPAIAWSMPTRLAFRFFGVFLFLNYFPYPLTALPKGEWAFKWYADLWTQLNAWVCGLVGAADLAASPFRGSGDRFVDYVSLFNSAILSLAITAVWTAIDRRQAWPRLHAGLRVFLRYALGAYLLSYGFIKIIKTQFPASTWTMLETYGESSPAGLLWTLMGQSTPYTVFGGSCEVLAGLLLFSRRTATVGALVAAGVMTNVVMLNFSYDVPVKLFSAQLLVTALFLLAPDARRLADTLLFNRAVAPAVYPTFRRRSWRVASAVAGTAFVGWLLYSNISSDLEGYTTYGDGAPTPAIYGMYDVVEVVSDGRVVPAEMNEKRRWRRVVFDRQLVVVRRMNEQLWWFGAKYDAEAGRVRMTQYQVAPSYLAYTAGENGEVLLDGLLDNALVTIRLRPSDPSLRELENRGFHWVNEYPYIR